MKILVVDVGGTHVKVLATGRRQRVVIPVRTENDPGKDGRRGPGRHRGVEI